MIKFKPRHNTHENDCWCDAIALATNQDYEVVYELFKPFMEEDGGLDDRFTGGYLDINGYITFTEDVTLYEALQLFDSREGIVISLKNDFGSHVIYVKNRIIYDNVRKVEEVNYLVSYRCDKIYAKIDDEYNLI